jgi:diacylglycerol kinase family enzyme
VADSTDSIFPDAPAFDDDHPLLVMANPSSRSGKSFDRFDRIKQLLTQNEVPFDFRVTRPKGETVDIVSEAILNEGFRTIAYVGGDGTFNEVAKGICQSGFPRKICLGMLPSGTANDQGKSFGISSADKSIETNIQIIKAGNVEQLDVGEISAISDAGVVMRRDLFFDSVGWGLSAAILAFRNREREAVRKVPVVRDMYRDHMVYVRAAMHELALNWVTRDRFTAEITVDGEVHTLDQLSDLLINNTPIYAGDWAISPECNTDDGQLEVSPFRGTRDWTSKLILHHKKNPLTEKLVNRIGISHSPTFRGSDIKIQIFKPNRDKRIPAELDGEEFPPADRFDIKVHRRMISLIVPKDHHWI